MDTVDIGRHYCHIRRCRLCCGKIMRYFPYAEDGLKAERAKGEWGVSLNRIKAFTCWTPRIDDGNWRTSTCLDAAGGRLVRCGSTSDTGGSTLAAFLFFSSFFLLRSLLPSLFTLLFSHVFLSHTVCKLLFPYIFTYL